MAISSADCYSDSEQRAVMRLLDSLDRIDRRTGVHFEKVRSHARQPYRGIVWLAMPDDVEVGGNPQDHAVKVYARSLSRSGLAFVCPSYIPHRRVLCGLTLANGTTRWMEADVVRRRETREQGFWEYGVSFCKRVEA